MSVYELNMDGLVGPTHHYAGLSTGNLASTQNAHAESNPAAAAHQGIQKMRLLHHLGLKQGILPPHQRPNLALLAQLGFTGTPAEQVRKAKQTAPALLSACYSASSMWTANAATVSPSTDTHDGRVHFTAANLVNNLHRYQEAPFSHALLQRVFADPHYFHHHAPLPNTLAMSDEGAANHSRLCEHHHNPGLHLFVYGKKALLTNPVTPKPLHFPARQTLEASEAIARRHGLNPDDVLFACQNPEVIDQGVFHNDVIAVANESVFLLHEKAYVNQPALLATLRQKATFPLHLIEVSNEQITVQEAVSSYLFNSQLVTVPSLEGTKTMALIAPIECEQQPRIKAFIDETIATRTNPITQVYYLDLKQSMRNGGGPACLRLRMPLQAPELAAMHHGVLVNDTLLDRLDTWVDKHYRTSLQADSLDDPALIEEVWVALDELTSILGLGAIYPFQQ